jgi:hypothetical protein
LTTGTQKDLGIAAKNLEVFLPQRQAHPQPHRLKNLLSLDAKNLAIATCINL